ncbi:MAG: single-stranded-DNA-specific exonuclease RecJ [Gammaproteobacteria bacterium]|nr:single-stranded-DNA-specific exonuclease RecJ [Gammaproteobacteria bacterium]MBT8104705.1 single-stranded-DNA-specific exonuclease RecJ [Gammaproteobacteria bacterium]NNF48912.1 single-stranded-DNA-specific exonuclease RecJ [Woeseiaceae bacterium]NNK24719.1 single-stranded-DNA-specific exonuclease RecJ [Woeseiaceae bacterium]NNL62422.1 single-stranded-DNA-specific exonuclease RecJ [Woeseiaceae bacterium]
MPSAAAMAALGDIDPVHARLFAMRGLAGPEELDYGLARLAPVSSLDNIDEAAELVIAHRERRIIVVGDFDVDGATSTALVLRCLREFGFGDVDYLVPNRFDYGYGLTPEIVSVAAQRDPALLLTVDNGISSIEGVEEANRLGIPVLVTDHHLPGENLPEATVILNPNLPGSAFPSTCLAGVGVAFYLMARVGRMLEAQGVEGAAKVPAKYLDLVALGTVADVVPLDHNNRVLVHQGLRRIRAGRSIAGIQALLQQAGRQPARCVSSDLGFAAGPRINAAGRLEDISVGIECLLSDDFDTAMHHAGLLDRINSERRDIEATMRDQAFAYVDSLGAQRWPACVCVYDAEWHQGVVGLIAARVRERCHRPVIAFARESDELLKGSARSIQGVHVRDLLEAVHAVKPELIVKFGGHAMAAGLTIAEAHFAQFREVVAAQMARLYPDADFSGAIVTDGPLPGEALSLEFARSLREAGPWGAAFPEPTWCGDFTIEEQRVVGQNHLKLRVRPAAGGRAVDAIAFNQAGPAYRGTIQLAFRLDVNEYRGVESPQLVVEQVAEL